MTFFDTKWQDELFKRYPSQISLLSLTNKWPLEEIEITVIRNQPFEYIMRLVTPFLNYVGFKPNFRLSNYDDIVPKLSYPKNQGDITIVWLDFNRYNDLGITLIQFLERRMHEIINESNTNILFINKMGIDKEYEFNNLARTFI